MVLIERFHRSRHFVFPALHIKHIINQNSFYLQHRVNEECMRLFNVQKINSKNSQRKHWPGWMKRCKDSAQKNSVSIGMSLIAKIEISLSHPCIRIIIWETCTYARPIHDRWKWNISRESIDKFYHFYLWHSTGESDTRGIYSVEILQR